MANPPKLPAALKCAAFTATLRAIDEAVARILRPDPDQPPIDAFAVYRALHQRKSK